MSQQELLKRVSYMITGSVASSMQGEPRSTHDIDIVVDIDASQTEKVIEIFPAENII